MLVFDPVGGLEAILVLQGGIDLVIMLQSIEHQWPFFCQPPQTRRHHRLQRLCYIAEFWPSTKFCN